MKLIKSLFIDGEKLTNIPFEINQLKDLGLSNQEIEKIEHDLNLEEHAMQVKTKVGQVLSAVTKDTQTQTNLQAKFSLINLVPEGKQTEQEKAIKNAIVALGLWVSAVMDLGNKSKKDPSIPVENIEWPELDAAHKAVIEELVERF